MTSSNDSISKHSSADLSGSVFLISADGRMLKLPIPARSYRDPLNWSTKKRLWALISITAFATIGLVVVEVPTLMIAQLTVDFPPSETEPFELDVLVSAPTLFLGIGSLIWIPLSLLTGRRPVFLLCTILLAVSTIWASLAGSFLQLLAAVSMQGLVVGFSVSATLLTIIDLTFIHERPNAIAMYWGLPSALALILLSTLPSRIATMAGWRTFYAIWVIPCCVCIPLVLFLFPETYFIRPAVAFDGRILAQSPSEQVTIYENWEEVPGGEALPDAPESSVTRRWLRELAVFRCVGSWGAMGACYSQILFCLINPLIFWVVLLNAVAFGGMLSIGTTFPAVMMAPPYSQPLPNIDLVNLAAAIGSLLAWPISFYTIGWTSRRLTVAKGGVRHAEHYLPAFALPIITGVASVVLYGFAAQHQWPMFWIFFAYGLNSFSYSSLSTANTLWVTEAFPRWAAPALVLVGGGSYIESFSMSFAIPPWVRAQGYALVNLEIGIAFVAIGFIIVPIAFWGQKMRQVINGRWAANQRGALRPQ